MGNIKPIKPANKKIEEISVSKPKDVQEATINLLNLVVKEKREFSLKEKAHKLPKEPSPQVKKVSKLFKSPKKK